MTDRDSLAGMLGLYEAIRGMDWHDRASCKETDGEAFFPLGTRKPPPEIAALCKACPVQLECLAQGMNEKEGFWGGKTKAQRDRLRKKQAKVEA